MSVVVQRKEVYSNDYRVAKPSMNLPKCIVSIVFSSFLVRQDWTNSALVSRKWYQSMQSKDTFCFLLNKKNADTYLFRGLWNDSKWLTSAAKSSYIEKRVYVDISYSMDFPNPQKEGKTPFVCAKAAVQTIVAKCLFFMTSVQLIFFNRDFSEIYTILQIEDSDKFFEEIECEGGTELDCLVKDLEENYSPGSKSSPLLKRSWILITDLDMYKNKVVKLLNVLQKYRHRMKNLQFEIYNVGSRVQERKKALHVMRRAVANKRLNNVTFRNV